MYFGGDERILFPKRKTEDTKRWGIRTLQESTRNSRGTTTAGARAWQACRAQESVQTPGARGLHGLFGFAFLTEIGAVEKMLRETEFGTNKCSWRNSKHFPVVWSGGDKAWGQGGSSEVPKRGLCKGSSEGSIADAPDSAHGEAKERQAYELLGAF